MVIAVVGHIGACPYPASLVQPEVCCGVYEWLHSIVKLAVGLFAVDDVEAVRHLGCSVCDFEKEPLMVMVSIDVRIQQEVIFILTDLYIYA